MVVLAIATEHPMSRVDRLEKGRKASAKHEWRDAYAFLSFADLEIPLGGADLAMLAESAVLLGGDARASATRRQERGRPRAAVGSRSRTRNVPR
jgi:hypothetical protein